MARCESNFAIPSATSRVERTALNLACSSTGRSAGTTRSGCGGTGPGDRSLTTQAGAQNLGCDWMTDSTPCGTSRHRTNLATHSSGRLLSIHLATGLDPACWCRPPRSSSSRHSEPPSCFASADSKFPTMGRSTRSTSRQLLSLHRLAR
eukprot:4152977-Pyramimonas_sp.AAC.1